jgi:hypothetical protein
MKNSFSRLFLAPLAVLVLGSVALAPLAEAAGKKGGGGAHAVCGCRRWLQNVTGAHRSSMWGRLSAWVARVVLDSFRLGCRTQSALAANWA